MPSELLKFIKLSETTDSPWQGRLQNVDKNDIEELADSIKQNGLMQPVIVREKDNKYEIIDGHRRVAAYKLLGLGQVKAVIKRYNDKQAQLFSIIGNLQREQLNPIEQALTFQKVFEAGLYTGNKELSIAIGKDSTYVGDVMNTLKMDKRIIEDVAKHNTIRDVRMLRMIRSVEPTDKKNHSTRQWLLYQKVINERLTRSELQDLLKKEKEKSAKSGKSIPWQIKPGKTTIQMKLKTGKIPPELQKKIVQLLEEKLAEVAGHF